jgi:MFS family permease
MNRIQTKLFFFLLGIFLWLGFGGLISGIGAAIIGYTWVLSAIGYGAGIGFVTGLIISLMGLAVSSWLKSKNVMLWMQLGSIIGGSIGFVSVIVFGGYPKRDQANLGFLALGPMGVFIGALLGILVGVSIWKYRHRHSYFKYYFSNLLYFEKFEYRHLLKSVL